MKTEKIAKFMVGIVLAIISILLLCSCDNNIRNEVARQDNVPFADIKEYTYKNHQYIKFSTGRYSSGVVHNPDCSYCK